MFWALKYFVLCLFLLKCSIEIRGKEDLEQNVVIRVSGGDLFTVSSDMNSYRSINCSCVSGNEFKESHFVNISNGVCTFQCNADKPTYLVQERKCVNFSQLLNNLPTSAEDAEPHQATPQGNEQEDCRHWLSVSYSNKQENYTRKLSNVIDFESHFGFIDLNYNRSNKLFLEYDSCFLITETIFYVSNQGMWKSIQLENITIDIFFYKKLPSLVWWGVRKSKFLGKIIKVKVRCVSETNEDQEKRFCIMLKTKGTIALPFKILPYSGPTPTSNRCSGTTYTTHKSNTSEEQTIVSGENKNLHMTGIVAAAVVVVLVLLFVAVGLFVKGRYLRKNSNEEFGNRADLNGQLHQDKTEPSENGFVHQATLQQLCIVQTKEATPDYVIPCQTKNSEMSNKENSAAAGSNPCRPDPEYESEWDYEKLEGPIYQELQNRPSNSENCDYSKLVFQMRDQTLSPMQDN